jgi:hypothetical protein
VINVPPSMVGKPEEKPEPIYVDIHKSTPIQRGGLESLSVKVDRLMRAHDRQFDQLIAQYDAIIAKPHVDPMVSMRAIEAKTRLLTAISENASRIALAIQREQKLMDDRGRTKAIDRATAIRLIDHNRKVQNNPVNVSIVGSTKPPKVRMFELGYVFKATVGPSEMEMVEPA